MKKILFVALIALLFFSCRKDNSVLLNTNITQCLITNSLSTDGKYSAEVKYQDGLATENIIKENGVISTAWYTTVESPKQLIIYSDSKLPENAKTRIYLNEFGSLAKEVALELNPNGTLSEDTTQKRLFTYNSNKLLTKIITSINDEYAVFDISYDSKSRLEKITISDGNGLVFIIYDNFIHDDHKKTDNLTTIALFDSFSALYLPSLNSTYVKSYRIFYPDIPELTLLTSNEFKFSNQKLSQIKSTITLLGVANVSTVNVTLNCK
ncbi:hypothetical protein [Pedobacter glucosidilyticus]|uniref:hypothetical protein n=1 Tax=Pedobacter glucosidilyticus TaxID=1122941 RepID=UPI00047E14F3|nr:hypothetical protein [Pedobacter glucosidilyticus]